jgi:hypothetical protein
MREVIRFARRAAGFVYARPMVAAVLVIALVIPVLGSLEKVSKSKAVRGTVSVQTVALKQTAPAFAPAKATSAKTSSPVARTGGTSSASVAPEVAQAAVASAQQQNLTPDAEQLVSALGDVANAKSPEAAKVSATKAAEMSRLLVPAPGGFPGFPSLGFLFCPIIFALGNGPFGAFLANVFNGLWLFFACGTVSG